MGVVENGIHAVVNHSDATEGPFLYMNFGAPSSDPAICNLDPNKTYYFNVIFDSPYDGYDATAFCSSSGSNHCGFRMAVQ